MTYEFCELEFKAVSHEIFSDVLCLWFWNKRQKKTCRVARSSLILCLSLAKTQVNQCQRSEREREGSVGGS